LHDPKHLNYTKGKLNKLIIGANQEFQDALDEIEIEIVSLDPSQASLDTQLLSA